MPSPRKYKPFIGGSVLKRGSIPMWSRADAWANSDGTAPSEPILRTSTLARKVKVCFNPPLVEWFMGPLRAPLLDIMRSQEFRQCSFFDGRDLGKRFERWLKSPNWEDAWGFWPPVHFVLWRRGLKDMGRSPKERMQRSLDCSV